MKSSKVSVSRRSLWQKKSLLAAIIVLLLAASGAGWYFLKGTTPVGVQTDAQTYTATVKRGDLSVSALGSGKLVSGQSVDLSFPTTGTVTELNVKLGDMVKAGAVLARMGNSEDLEASVAAAQLALLKAQKTLTDLQQNAKVSLAQAYSDLLTAQDTYDTALNASQKSATKRCSKEVTRQYLTVLERATTDLNHIHAEKAGSDAFIAAKKQYDTALANYNYCASYTAEEQANAQSALAVAKTALQDAQDQYDTLKSASGIDPDELALDEANLATAQAQLASAKDKLTGATLTAPMDGKVTYLAASAGEMVDTAKFITIADVSQPTLDISVDESDLSKLVIGSAASVSFDALTDQSFSGTVVQVNPLVTTSGRYKVAQGQVELDASAAKTLADLPLGLSASVTIVNKEAKNALLIPFIALKDLGDNSYAVMLKGSDGHFKLQTVTIGIQTSDYVEIISGLKEGDQVSTGTTHFIAAGSTDNSSSLKNAQNSGLQGGPPVP